MGSGSADLWISAQAADVDLQVTLTELRPDGQEMLVQSGWLRASHCALDEDESTALRPRQLHTEDASNPLPVNQPTAVRVEIFPFAHAFRAGSRIQISVEGPGGGSHNWPWDFAFLPGGFDVTVHHDAKHPSKIVLPVIEVPGFEVPPRCRPAGRSLPSPAGRSAE